jgi:hypothetical protein
MQGEHNSAQVVVRDEQEFKRFILSPELSPVVSFLI